jgi:hypothetical protein
MRPQCFEERGPVDQPTLGADAVVVENELLFRLGSRLPGRQLVVTSHARSAGVSELPPIGHHGRRYAFTTRPVGVVEQPSMLGSVAVLHFIR